MAKFSIYKIKGCQMPRLLFITDTLTVLYMQLVFEPYSIQTGHKKIHSEVSYKLE